MSETDAETSQANNETLEPEQKRKIFIGSLSYQIEENIFRDYWTKFGTVIEATILRDRDGHSRGFGFVTFTNSSSVDAVMQARPHTLDNRVVETKRAVSREDSHKPNMQLSVKKLYLGGIKDPIGEDDLKSYFSKYGNILSTIIMKDREGQYRGYDPVDRVILEKSHVVCGRSLDVQKAQARDGQQRPNNQRSRPVLSNMLGSNYNRTYSDGNYPSNNFGNNFDQITNSNGYPPHMNNGNRNWTPFGQDYHQDPFAGPMRRGNMAGSSSSSGRAYAPYNNRSTGYRARDGAGDADNSGSSWTSWA